MRDQQAATARVFCAKSHLGAGLQRLCLHGVFQGENHGHGRHAQVGDFAMADGELATAGIHAGDDALGQVCAGCSDWRGTGGYGLRGVGAVALESMRKVVKADMRPPLFSGSW